MLFPPTLSVTEQPIDISHVTSKQKRYYLDLAKEITSRYEAGGRCRQIFNLSGPAGSGKSVIAAILELIYKESSLFQFLNISLDAFHFSNSILEERGLLAVKGRYDTYNTELLREKLAEFKAGGSVLFPTYSREVHQPIPDRLPTANENILLLLEGQWLLRTSSEWQAIRDLSSYNYVVSGPLEKMRENVIQRHIAGGRTPEDAEAFYLQSDLPNTKEVLEKCVQPDKKLLFYKEI